MKKKILILGCSSFAGSSFSHFISNQNKYDIYGSYNSKSNLDSSLNKRKFDLNFIKINLLKPNLDLLKIVKKIRPNYIIDFASICLVNESWFNPKNYFQINVQSKINLIKNLNKLKFLDKFIYISTPEVFGSTTKPVKENCENFSPSTPYALSKYVTEKILKSYNESFKKKSIIARFSNFYGISQTNHRLIPKLISCIKSNKKFPLHGTGNSKRNFIFEDDFNAGILKLIKFGKNGTTYHFSSDNFFTIKEVVKIVCNYYNKRYDDIVIQTKDRIAKDKYYFLDCKKTKKNLNWKAKVQLETGIKKIIDFYEKKNT